MDFKISTAYDGKKRKVYSYNCLFCHVEFWSPKHAHKKYCSPFCAYEANKKRVALVCSFCGSTIEKVINKLKNSKSGFLFCNRKCKEQAQRIGGISALHPPHYKNGVANYKLRAIREQGNKCILCGNEGIWQGKELILDVHHIDGNRKNGAMSNLMVLCCNCHRQEEMKKWVR